MVIGIIRDVCSVTISCMLSDNWLQLFSHGYTCEKNGGQLNRLTPVFHHNVIRHKIKSMAYQLAPKEFLKEKF